MRTLPKFSGRFIEICDAEDSNNNKQNNTDNKTYFDGLIYNGYDSYKPLNVIAEDIINGKIKGNVYWVSSASAVNGVKWWKIPEGTGALYTELQELHNSSTNAGENKKEAAMVKRIMQ